MSIRVLPSSNLMKWDVPGSKSIINRILIRAFHLKKPINLLNMNYCDDVLHTLNALKELGMSVIENDSELEIQSFKQKADTELSFFLGEGGTTIRFLIPLLASMGKEIEVSVGDAFKNRPISELVTILENLDVEFYKKDYPLKFKGQFTFSELNIETDCSKTTQIASAFKLLGANVSIQNNESSQNFLSMTDEVINLVENNKTLYAETDHSLLLFPYLFNKLHGELSEFPESSFQNENELLTIIEKGNRIIDLSNFLDNFPILCFYASYSGGEYTFTGLNNLAYKESNRIHEMTKLLDIFKIDFSYNESKDEFVINKSEKIKHETAFESPNDHRIAMTAFLFLKYNFGGVLFNSECIKKSFPRFIEIYN